MSNTFKVISRFLDREKNAYVDPPGPWTPPSPEERDRLIRARCLEDKPITKEDMVMGNDSAPKKTSKKKTSKKRATK